MKWNRGCILEALGCILVAGRFLFYFLEPLVKRNVTRASDVWGFLGAGDSLFLGHLPGHHFAVSLWQIDSCISFYHFVVML